MNNIYFMFPLWFFLFLYQFYSIFFFRKFPCQFQFVLICFQFVTFSLNQFFVYSILFSIPFFKLMFDNLFFNLVYSNLNTVQCTDIIVFQSSMPHSNTVWNLNSRKKNIFICVISFQIIKQIILWTWYALIMTNFFLNFIQLTALFLINCKKCIMSEELRNDSSIAVQYIECWRDI